MRCIKLSYTSPVFGSVDCYDIPNKHDQEVEFGPETALKLYEKSSRVREVFDEYTEDLVQHIPEELEGLVVKAVFGKLDAEDYDLKLVTEIYVRKEPTVEQHTQIIEWISGQMSDGWGEGVEQREVYHEEFEYELYVFDAKDCEYQSSTRYADAYYHLHPWVNDSSWSVRFEGRTPVDLDIEDNEAPVVHSAICERQQDGGYTVKTVYQVDNNRFAVLNYISLSTCYYSDEFMRWINDFGTFGDNIRLYFVLVNEGRFNKFLPVLGVVDMTTQRARLFTMDAENGHVDLQEYTEEEIKDFFIDLRNK